METTKAHLSMIECKHHDIENADKQRTQVRPSVLKEGASQLGWFVINIKPNIQKLFPVNKYWWIYRINK